MIIKFKVKFKRKGSAVFISRYCLKIWRIGAEAATTGVLWKNVFLKISQNSQINTFVRVSFLIKLQAWGCKKETLAQVLACAFCEIFKNTPFHRTPLMAASIRGMVYSNIWLYEAHFSSWQVTPFKGIRLKAIDKSQEKLSHLLNTNTRTLYNRIRCAQLWCIRNWVLEALKIQDSFSTLSYIWCYHTMVTWKIFICIEQCQLGKNIGFSLCVVDLYVKALWTISWTTLNF